MSSTLLQWRDGQKDSEFTKSGKFCLQSRQLANSHSGMFNIFGINIEPDEFPNAAFHCCDRSLSNAHERIDHYEIGTPSVNLYHRSAFAFSEQHGNNSLVFPSNLPFLKQ
jgi:hypothetical protein